MAGLKALFTNHPNFLLSTPRRVCTMLNSMKLSLMKVIHHASCTVIGMKVTDEICHGTESRIMSERLKFILGEMAPLLFTGYNESSG